MTITSPASAVPVIDWAYEQLLEDCKAIDDIVNSSVSVSTGGLKSKKLFGFISGRSKQPSVCVSEGPGWKNSGAIVEDFAEREQKLSITLHPSSSEVLFCT
jgi:hypothetical protein